MASERIAGQPVRDTFGGRSPISLLFLAGYEAAEQLGEVVILLDRLPADLREDEQIATATSEFVAAYRHVLTASKAMQEALCLHAPRLADPQPPAPIHELAPALLSSACLHCDERPCTCAPVAPWPCSLCGATRWSWHIPDQGCNRCKPEDFAQPARRRLAEAETELALRDRKAGAA